jgi:hypothetical protein
LRRLVRSHLLCLCPWIFSTVSTASPAQKACKY